VKYPRPSDGKMATLLIRKANRNIWITYVKFTQSGADLPRKPNSRLCVASMATMASLSATSRFRLVARFGAAALHDGASRIQCIITKSP
jgi:hypothetical protein